jgi:hypothetical protein
MQMARVDLRYPFFTARREPWELPLFAAAMWSDISRRRWDGTGAQIIQTVNGIDPVAEYHLEQLSPGVEVTGGEMPRYLVQLREAGAVDLVDDDRPADVIMLLEAGPAPPELQ